MLINGRECSNCRDIGERDEMVYCARDGCNKMICTNCYAKEVAELIGDDEFEVEDSDDFTNEHDIECNHCKGHYITDEELIEHALLLLGISKEDLEMSCRAARTIS